MLKRMEEIIPSKLPFYVGSLHGLSYRILQKYYSINYTILDEYETRELIKNETNLFFATFNGLVIEEDDINYIKYKICDIIDQISTTYPLNFKPILKKYNLIKYNNIIQQIYKAFSKKKKIENYIDFNDLMIMFCEFLKNPKSDDFKNQIKYVFFDEYQDINQIQNYILSVFKNKSKIMVVGDDAQSIYSFRGSSVNFILDFPTIFTPNEKYLLVENYRSTPSIVNFCEEIIKKNTNQFKKEVKSIQDQFGVLPDIHAFDKKITKEFTCVVDKKKLNFIKPHIDASVVNLYFQIEGDSKLDNGIGFYNDNKLNIKIGFKENRAILFDAKLLHSSLLNEDATRTTLTIFIKEGYFL
jgi:superfamily I DNA/RNA helicase